MKSISHHGAPLAILFVSSGARDSSNSTKMIVEFKVEEDMQEYLKNIGIQYRFSCFSEKNSEGCHLLGEYMNNVKRDPEKASQLFKTNCDEYNHPRSCHNYGRFVLMDGQNKDRAKNFDNALQYIIKACGLGYPRSCLHAGLMDIKNPTKDENERNYDRGLESLDKACELGNKQACFYLSGMYMASELVQKDMKQAFKYTKKACELGNVYACSNLSLMYKKGEGVEQNEEMYKKMRRKALEILRETKSSVNIARDEEDEKN